MYDICALGELLIDFTPAGVSAEGKPLFEQNPGGAPANVAACVARLGKSAAYIGKVGSDAFGKSLINTLSSFGVEVKGVKTTAFYPTTLAFVTLDENGERSFNFFRNNTADLRLTPGEVDMSLIDEAQVFCFGSVSMTGEPCCSATLAAAEYAKNAGKVVCFDPNVRLALWENEVVARDSCLRALQYTDILKLSLEELSFLTQGMSLHDGALTLLKRHNLDAVVVTRGEKGAYALTLSYELSVPAYQVKTIDTTGAGDAFLGGFLYRMLAFGKRPEKLSNAEMMLSLDFASAVGAMVTTRLGAMTALPTLEEVYDCMRKTVKE